MRIDELLTRSDRPSSPSSSSRRRPRRASATSGTRIAALKPLEPDYVSVTYGAGGSTRDKTLDIVERIRREYGLEAMAHFTCVGATVDELTATLDRDARARHRQRPGAARRPAAGPGDVDEDRGRAGVLARARRAHRRALRRVLRRRGLLPGDAHPRDRAPRTTCATSRRRSTRAWTSSSRSSSSTTPSTSTSSTAPARPASTCRSSRASCRSRTSRQIQRVTSLCKSRDPRPPARRARRARRRPGRRGGLRRRLRHAAVRRPARPRRARHPLLHAEPLAGDAGDPQRAEAPAAVGARRRADRGRRRLGRRACRPAAGSPGAAPRRRAVGAHVAHVDRVVLAVGRRHPKAPSEPAPAADAVLAQRAGEDEDAPASPRSRAPPPGARR